ncbi:MAG: hypothetical protein ACXW5U_09825 [Thermoanaerobaculia bacterium]
MTERKVMAAPKGRPKTYDEYVSSLATPEALEAAVFRPDGRFSPELCDFVLALAVAYNDLRDVILGWMLLGAVFSDEERPSPRAGQAGGLAIHLFRLITGFLHELLVLVDSSAEARAHPEFARIVKKTPADARKSWETLVRIKKGSKSDDPLARYVYWARNQVAFHYDPRSIRQGYELAFRDPARNVPYVSIGRSMAATRFYFADAAVDGYARDTTRASAPRIQDFLLGKSEMVWQIYHALREIVAEFIRRRRIPKVGSAT